MRARPRRSVIKASYKSADSLRRGQGRRCVLSTVQVPGRRLGFRDSQNQEKRCCPQGSHQGNREAVGEWDGEVAGIVVKKSQAVLSRASQGRVRIAIESTVRPVNPQPTLKLGGYV